VVVLEGEEAAVPGEKVAVVVGVEEAGNDKCSFSGALLDLKNVSPTIENLET
jgi:hypothetical protein